MKHYSRLAALVLLEVLPALAAAASPAAHLGWNFDTGMDAAGTERLLVEQIGATPPEGSWLRLRGMETAPVPDDVYDPSTEQANGARAPQSSANFEHAIEIKRSTLEKLRKRGYRIVALLRWSAESWQHGTRQPGQPNRLPVDLREPFQRCRALAATYGDLIDYWEIDNEPDISFVQENVETYAAFLKGCYLGLQRGKADLPKSDKVATHNADSDSHHFDVSNFPSHVLMGALALPPGPYFENFVANGGLSYTDGFNYHYYGYAEDFTGVYRQFEFAVASLRLSRADSPASQLFSFSAFPTWCSRFYPNALGWSPEVTGRFDGTATDADIDSALVRPRAKEEPVMHRQGRWLVTDGAKVEESTGIWRFTVTSWPSGPLHAPVAELVLPPAWHFAPESLISFRYRAGDVPGPNLIASESKLGAGPISGIVPPANDNTIRYVAPIQDYSARKGAVADAFPLRELPVFLTEYGYGSLDKVTRDTADGRDRQRAWFSSVRNQTRDLGISGAMAFVLNPYLERDLLEFGLLMPKQEIRGDKSHLAPPFGNTGLYVSPALDEILRTSAGPLNERTWKVATPPPSNLVIDFIPGEGLGQAKPYGGYFLEGEHGRSVSGKGALVVYNFGNKSLSGELRLRGEAWAFVNAGGVRSCTADAMPIIVHPSERLIIPVTIWPKPTRFISSDVSTTFIERILSAAEITDIKVLRKAATTAPQTQRYSSTAAAQPVSISALPSVSTVPLNMFECYFRTANGNLYQTWPRLWPQPSWQQYTQRTDDFTAAFYGRAHLPWKFLHNSPVSLVFFFHPQFFPAVYEVTSPVMVRFSTLPPSRSPPASNVEH